MELTKKPLRFIVNENCSISATGNSGKPYRKQRVLVHHGDEVTKIEFLLDKDEPFLTPGEYRLAPDAVYIGTNTRVNNGKTYTEPALRVGPRFERVQVEVLSAGVRKAA